MPIMTENGTGISGSDQNRAMQSIGQDAKLANVHRSPAVFLKAKLCILLIKPRSHKIGFCHVCKI